MLISNEREPGAVKVTLELIWKVGSDWFQSFFFFFFFFFLVFPYKGNSRGQNRPKSLP